MLRGHIDQYVELASASVTTSLYQPSRGELAELLEGEPRYRVDQIWQGLYQNLATPAEMTNIPKALRTTLSERLDPALQVVVRRVSDGGDTVKYLWELHDGTRIETVLMLYPDRVTVCVSSQVGCAMGCGFCATGQAGFTRHLTVGEIVEQVVAAAREARSMERRLGNVVFMGMGEPLANEATVWDSVVRLHDDLGLSARKITISTVGVVPGIRRLTERPLPVNLAVSLHAANDNSAQRVGSDQQALSHRRVDEGVRRLPGGERTTAELRVGDDRRRQRPTERRRGAGQAVPSFPSARARQPDPAEPDARLPDRRLTAEACARVPRLARGARCQRDGSAQSGHRHRRRLRSARRRPAGHHRTSRVTASRR